MELSVREVCVRVLDEQFATANRLIRGVTVKSLKPDILVVAVKSLKPEILVVAVESLEARSGGRVTEVVLWQ